MFQIFALALMSFLAFGFGLALIVLAVKDLKFVIIHWDWNYSIDWDYFLRIKVMSTWLWCVSVKVNYIKTFNQFTALNHGSFHVKY